MKNILLAVTGLSPQVITETLYALHQAHRKVDAIHIITTRDGKDRIYAGLLAGGKGHFFRYLKEYDIEPETIDFGPRNLHVLRDEHGIELPDIVNESDNERLLRKCLELTFHLTKDPDTAMFFSVAGGRKTMSACLTLAAQMYGRSQDRLYHVLVSPDFEGSRNFFYPPRNPRLIELTGKDGQPFSKSTAYADINLIHLPFFSIRKELSSDYLQAPHDPATLMMSLVREERAHLVVNLISKKIVYKNIELDMMPARMALYAFFAMQKKGCPKVQENCGKCTECFLDLQTVFEKQHQITDIYRRVCGTRPIGEMSDSGITGLSSENFNSYKSRIREKLQSAFGPYGTKDLEIAPVGSRPNTRYGILMDKGKMEIVY